MPTTRTARASGAGLAAINGISGVRVKQSSAVGGTSGGSGAVSVRALSSTAVVGKRLSCRHATNDRCDTARSRSCMALDEAAALVEEAFQQTDVARCRDVTARVGSVLTRSSPKALVSLEAARFCAMLAAVLQHPEDSCRSAAIGIAAREWDVALLLRIGPRALVCNSLDPARRTQVVENVLKVARILLSFDSCALERCRLAGGLITAIEICRNCPFTGDVMREALQLVVLFAQTYSKAVATAGGVELAVSNWQRVVQQSAPNESEGQILASPATQRYNILVLPIAELLLHIFPHIAAARLVSVSPLVMHAIPICTAHGSQRSITIVLQLITKMASDASIASDLLKFNATGLVLDLLGHEGGMLTLQTRRAAANAYVHVSAGVLKEGRRQLSTAPRILCHGKDATSTTLSNLGFIPEGPTLEFSTSARQQCDVIPESPELQCAQACSGALKRYLSALPQWVVGREGKALYPVSSYDDSGNFLRFDANFEGANLRSAAALNHFEYELQLCVDFNNPAHCQWFFWKMSGTRANVVYTFHIVNLSKPASLFEEGAQPVLFSRKRHQDAGVGWTHVGFDVAYYSNGGLLPSGKPAHTLSFSLSFEYAEDDVYVAHYFPYGYNDLKRDMARWSRTSCNFTPHADKTASEGQTDAADHSVAQKSSVKCAGNRYVQKAELLKTPGGFSVEMFQLGSTTGSKPLVVMIARAHPGETPASWMMRGVCEHLLTDDSIEAGSCRSICDWILVPMMNPDGVVLGNTRTNTGGVDLNRHHHDEAATETVALRSLITKVMAGRGSRPPFAFIDIHGHSRRKGIFLMGNAGASGRLPELLSERSSTFDLAGSSFYPAHPGGRDAGVGRVAMARVGCPHSFTLEASFGVPFQGATQLTTNDLESLGRALCNAVTVLAESEEDTHPHRVDVA